MVSLTTLLGGLLLAGSALTTLSQPLPGIGTRLFCTAATATLCPATRVHSTHVAPLICVPMKVALEEGGLSWEVLSQVVEKNFADQDSASAGPVGENSGWQVNDLTSVFAGESRDAPGEVSCLGLYESVRWMTDQASFSWLRLRLSQVESLQPRRCVIAPTICWMDC